MVILITAKTMIRDDELHLRELTEHGGRWDEQKQKEKITFKP